MKNSIRRPAGITSVLLVVAMATTTLAGCASSSKPTEKPAKLVKLESNTQLQRLWKRSVGDGDGRAALALEPVKANGFIYTAAENGTVMAINAETGDVAWKKRVNYRLKAGPGADSRVVAVCAEDGKLIALNPETGAELWQLDTGGELLAPPLADRGLVVLRTLDGRIRAVSAIDGTTQWILNRAVPRLTLRGNSAPVLKDDRIFVGLDNGKLLALNQRDGSVVWETAVAIPSGRGDIERMVDIDGRPRAADSDVYVNSFQGRLVSVAAESGRVLWAKDLSGTGDLDVFDDSLIVSDIDGRVLAFDRFSSTKLWEQDQLLHRGITGPVYFDNSVLVADKNGYVHLLDPTDGSLKGRFRVDGSAIVNSPKVIDGVLYVQTSGGTLAAYSQKFGNEARDSLSEMLEEVREDSPKAQRANSAAAEANKKQAESSDSNESELEKGFGGGFRLGN